LKEEILIAGYGGQGIVVTGSLFANAALKSNLHTCGMVCYGAEMRGGAANATVTISDSKIGSPVVVHPDAALILNDLSLEVFEKDIKPGGLLILNSSECKNRPKRSDIVIVEVAATKIAQDLGNKKVANMVMVGAYLKKKTLLSFETVEGALATVLPKADSKLLEINKKALKQGYR
jgi:2-oxoglutarate ferredoxin oxidoreductase subunit gamma